MVRRKRWLFLLVLSLVAFGLFMPYAVRAADVRTDENVIVATDEVIPDDLYAFANTVTIHGAVQGDVIAFGSRVLIDGRVEGDVMGAAEVLEINGIVTDDVRAAGQLLVLGENAQIEDDTFIGAYTLQSLAGSYIGGDLGFATGQAALDGDVAQSVWGSSAAVRLGGTIGGDVTLDLGDSEGTTVLPMMPSFSGTTLPSIPSVPIGLTVDEGAQIKGQVYYTSTTQAMIAPALANAPIRTEPPVTTTATPTPTMSPLLTGIFDYLRRVVTLLLVGLLLLGVRSAWVQQSGERIRTHYLHSIGWGFVAYVAFFVVAVLLFIGVIALTAIAGGLTLGGLAAALFGIGALTEASYILLFLLVVNYIAQVIVNVMAGRWLLQRFYPAWAERPIAQLTVGVFLLALLEVIPYVGMIVGWLVVLPVLGVLLEGGRTFLRPSAPSITTSTPPTQQGMPMAGVA